MAGSSYTGPHGPQFLHDQIKSLLAFYDPICRDDELGGFHNQLRDDVYDSRRKHCVGTARFTVNYSLASLLYNESKHKDLVSHGVSFLMDRQQDPKHGGFFWVLNGHEVEDGDKWCYSIAFGLLALANAHKAGVVGTRKHITTVLALAEDRYLEPAHGLYIDSFPRDFSAPAPYRGQNANMHIPNRKAHIALYEALHDSLHLERATGIAYRLVVAFPKAAGCNGRVIEHYTTQWVPDTEKNRDADPASEEYIFRPFGFQPGHSFEWVKLILLIERHQREAGAAEESIAWMLPAAELLFKTACECGWDEERGGAYYTFDTEGVALDQNKYYWALAEMIAAAGLLGQRTGSSEVWGWYDKAWSYALSHFIDSERGGWYPMLDSENIRRDNHAAPGHTGPPVKCYPSKTDYHPLAASYEVLRAMALPPGVSTQTLKH